MGPETAKDRAPEHGHHGKIPHGGLKCTATAWCLERHHLVSSKCVAGRDRDWPYAADGLKAGIVRADVLLLARLPDLPVAEELRDHIEKLLRGIIAS